MGGVGWSRVGGFGGYWRINWKNERTGKKNNWTLKKTVKGLSLFCAPLVGSKGLFGGGGTVFLTLLM